MNWRLFVLVAAGQDIFLVCSSAVVSIKSQTTTKKYYCTWNSNIQHTLTENNSSRPFQISKAPQFVHFWFYLWYMSVSCTFFPMMLWTDVRPSLVVRVQEDFTHFKVKHISLAHSEGKAKMLSGAHYENRVGQIILWWVNMVRWINEKHFGLSWGLQFVRAGHFFLLSNCGINMIFYISPVIVGSAACRKKKKLCMESEKLCYSPFTPNWTGVMYDSSYLYDYSNDHLG